MLFKKANERKECWWCCCFCFCYCCLTGSYLVCKQQVRRKRLVWQLMIYWRPAVKWGLISSVEKSSRWFLLCRGQALTAFPVNCYVVGSGVHCQLCIQIRCVLWSDWVYVASFAFRPGVYCGQIECTLPALHSDQVCTVVRLSVRCQLCIQIRCVLWSDWVYIVSFAFRSGVYYGQTDCTLPVLLWEWVYIASFALGQSVHCQFYIQIRCVV